MNDDTTVVGLIPRIRQEQITRALENMNKRLLISSILCEVMNIKHIAFSEHVLTHVASIVFEKTKKNDAGARGWHYDPDALLENSNIIKLSQPEIDPETGIISRFGRLVESPTDNTKPKTFFPPHWTVDEILLNAQKALSSIVVLPTLDGLNYTFIGKNLDNNIQIKFITDMTGIIKSFYPIINNKK